MSQRKNKQKSKKRQYRPQRPQQSPGRTIIGAETGDEAAIELGLREAILKFAYAPRFRDDFERALARYFGEEFSSSRVVSAERGEIADFQEWYFSDFATQSGQTIFEIFLREEGAKLSQKEREFLALWERWNRYRLFEVQAATPGIGIVVTDLLSGETLEVQDRSASRAFHRWAIILARPFYTDRLHFTGGGLLLSPLKKPALLEYARQLLADFQTTHPQATLDDFYRQHGLDIRQFMLRKAQEQPSYIIPEGHPLAFCTAYYDVTDGDAAAERLQQAVEYNFAGRASDDTEALRFNWLLRGRSQVPEQPKPKGEAIILGGEWFQEPGSPKFRTLGDVTLWPDRLEFSCMSKARLVAGKALLATVLRQLIRHQRDKVESAAQVVARQPAQRPRNDDLPPDVAEALSRDALRERYEAWPDELPEGFGGQTPRQAVQDAEGRAKVIDTLKAMEYIEDQRRRNGKAWYDINIIRRELGLPVL